MDYFTPEADERALQEREADEFLARLGQAPEIKKEISMTEGLKLLRAAFPAHQISKLPKPTKAQTEAVKTDYKAGIRCEICGTWHHPKVVHLDYVGHAALTDRLLDADPAWSWEPLSHDTTGLPAIDRDGGLWIRLTVCGVTRLGYGDAQGKTGGDAMKERIGDALRNAAMRFGAALDLWHKGDLHIDDDESADKKKGGNPPAPKPGLTENTVADFMAAIKEAPDMDILKKAFTEATTAANGAGDNAAIERFIKAKDDRKAAIWPEGVV